MNRLHSVIDSVYVFDNGVVMVCDQYGDMIIELQGLWRDKRDEIENAILVANKAVAINFNVFRANHLLALSKLCWEMAIK